MDFAEVDVRDSERLFVLTFLVDFVILHFDRSIIFNSYLVKIGPIFLGAGFICVQIVVGLGHALGIVDLDCPTARVRVQFVINDERAFAANILIEMLQGNY